MPAGDGGPAQTLLNVGGGRPSQLWSSRKLETLSGHVALVDTLVGPPLPASVAQITIPLQLSRLRPTKRLKSASWSVPRSDAAHTYGATWPSVVVGPLLRVHQPTAGRNEGGASVGGARASADEGAPVRCTKCWESAPEK